METFSQTRPEFFAIEKTHDKKLIVRFAEDIEEVTIGEESGFRYIETVGEFPWSSSLEARIQKDPQKFLDKIKNQ